MSWFVGLLWLTKKALGAFVFRAFVFKPTVKSANYEKEEAKKAVL